MSRVLYNFGNLIVNAYKVEHGEIIFRLFAQQEIPDEIKDKKLAFTEWPEELTPYFHWQDIQDCKIWLAGGEAVLYTGVAYGTPLLEVR